MDHVKFKDEYNRGGKKQLNYTTTRFKRSATV